MIKNTLKQMKFEDKTVKSTQFCLFSLASMISRSFQTIRRMREAWKWEAYVQTQSFSSESPVKYLHVGRRRIRISPNLGEQDQSNALPQGQRRQPNPHPMPSLPPPPPPLLDQFTVLTVFKGSIQTVSFFSNIM